MSRGTNLGALCLMGVVATKSHSAVRRRLAELANRQFGVLSRGQLRECGMSDSAIKHAIATDRLIPVLRGVYALGRSGIGERGRMFAATLACGEGAFVSHRSAAALMGLLDRAPASVDVIAPGQRGRKIDGVHWHGVRAPRPWEIGSFDGVPCTSPARTLVDLAGEVGMRTLRSCFERAAARKLLDVEAIELAMGSEPRRGMPDLRALLDEWQPAATIAATERLKSSLEAKVLPLLARQGLPAPLCNAPVELVSGRIEVDFLWPEQRVVVEADSRDFHATDFAFERDRWRDRELMRVGFSTLRVTRRQAEREADEVADAIRLKLSTS